MPVLAPAIGAAVAFLVSPMGLAIVGGLALSVVGGLVMKAYIGEIETAGIEGVQTELAIGEEVPTSSVFGRSMLPGHYLYHNEYGTDNESMQLVFALGNGRYDSMEKFYVDGEEVTLTGSNSDPFGKSVSTAKYVKDGNPHLWVKFYDGSLTQTADPYLVSNSAGRWTTDHRLAGIPYAIVTLLYHEDVYNSSIPKFTFQVKGLCMYDWRKDSTMPGGSGAHRWATPSTWEWTENPAVQLYNYKRGLYQNGVLVLGQGVTQFDIDLNRFTAAANLSEEDVVYPDTSTTIKRYAYSAIISDNNSAQTVIRSLESAMAGYGTEIGGAYGPLPGQQQTSVATINETDILIDQPVVAELRMAPSETYTAVSGVYTDPTNVWQAATYGIRYDAAVETAEGGRRLAVLDLPYINSYERANTIAEILRRRDRFQATETLTVGTKFASLEPGDVITRVKPLWGSKTFMITAREELDGKVSRLQMREHNNLVFPASGASFMPLPFVPGPPTTVPTRLTTVIGLTASAIPMTNADGENRAAIKVEWDPITDPTVLRVLVKYWPDTETEASAQIMPVEVRGSPSETVITGVVGSTLYHLKATIVTDPARPTTYTGVVNVTTLDEDFGVDLDGLIEEVTEAVIELDNFTRFTVREQLETQRQTIQLAVSGQLGDFTDRQLIQRSLVSETGASKAKFTEDILAATGPNSAIVLSITELTAEVFDPLTGLPAIAAATSSLSTQVTILGDEVDAQAALIDLLSVSVGEATAEGLFTIQVGTAPSGVLSRIVLSSRATAGSDTAAASLMLDAKLVSGVLTSEVLLVGGRVSLVSSTSPSATKRGLLVVDGDDVYIDNARIRELTAGNILAGTITSTQINVAQLLASSAFISNLVVDTANITNLSVDRNKIADGAFSDTYANSGGASSGGSNANLFINSPDFVGSGQAAIMSGGMGISFGSGGSDPGGGTTLQVYNVSTGAAEQVFSIGPGNHIINQTVNRILVNGQTYRLRFSIGTGSTGSYNISSYNFAIIAFRK